MPEQEHKEIVNVETHHETSDVNVRALLWFVAIFIVFAAVSHVVIWVMYRWLRQRDRVQTAPPLTAITRPVGVETPPQPRLQPFPDRAPDGKVEAPYTTTPVMDLQQMRAAEEEALTTPAWIDQQKGIVRLPIDIAKQLVVQQGLPVTGTSGTEGTTTATGTTGTNP